MNLRRAVVQGVTFLSLAGCSNHGTVGPRALDAGVGAVSPANDAGVSAVNVADGGRMTTMMAPDARASTGTDAQMAEPVGPLKPVDPAQLPRPDPNAVVIRNLDSAIINVEAVAGAKDYRAFVIEDGVEVLTDDQGREVVRGGTIFCAGQRQRAAPKLPVPEVMRQIEVTDLTKKKTFVVEAIDRLCPFPGLFGRTDTKINVTSIDATQSTPQLVVPFPIVSEASIRARYGSMIVNGHGPASQPGQPAEPNPPKVLKRWTVEVSPLPADQPGSRTKDFFADFSQADQPVWVPGGTNDNGTFHAPPDYGYSLAVYQNKDFVFYSGNTEVAAKNHVFIDRGQLHMVLPDLGQDVMGSVMAIPKKVAHVSDDSYLHVTFESSTNSTPRRYWWLSVCGPETAGKTFGSDGLLKDWIILLSGFFGADGRNPSTAGWNCLLIFPHDGIMTAVPPSGKENPQSSVMVIIHKANRPALQTSVNVSPQQLNDGYPRAWYRTQEAGKVTQRGVLDDLIFPAPRSRFDIYISRKKTVIYVNGEQRICNDFGSERLTMAEAAIGFNDALYHSSAEHTELTLDFANRSGQLYYLQNTLFADQHTFDNVGFEEGVALPSAFSANDCYTHAP